MEKKAFKTFTIRVDNDLRKVVDIKAAQMYLSCGELIRRALKEYEKEYFIIINRMYWLERNNELFSLFKSRY